MGMKSRQKLSLPPWNLFQQFLLFSICTWHCSTRLQCVQDGCHNYCRVVYTFARENLPLSFENWSCMCPNGLQNWLQLSIWMEWFLVGCPDLFHAITHDVFKNNMPLKCSCSFSYVSKFFDFLNRSPMRNGHTTKMRRQSSVRNIFSHEWSPILIGVETKFLSTKNNIVERNKSHYSR